MSGSKCVARFANAFAYENLHRIPRCFSVVSDEYFMSDIRYLVSADFIKGARCAALSGEDILGEVRDTCSAGINVVTVL